MPSEYGSIPQSENSAAGATDMHPAAPTLKQKVVAEFFGTCILVQVGTGSNCIGLFLQDTSGMWQIAVIWILAAALAIFCSGAISGGHLNPAVTLSFAVLRPNDFSMKEVVPYWIAQVLGGFFGALINFCLFYEAIYIYEVDEEIVRGGPNSYRSAAAFTDIYSKEHVASGLHACFLEGFGTAFLVFVIFAVTSARNAVPPPAVPVIVGVAIGCMVTLLGPLTNAGINPARDFGPRLALFILGWGSISFKNWLVYTVGPLIGGPLGGLLADRVFLME